MLIMRYLLVALLALPAILAIALSLSAIRNEKLISRSVALAMGIHLLLSVAIAAFWVSEGQQPKTFHYGNILMTRAASFPFDLSIDGFGLAYLILCSFSAFVVARFSRYYMHREEGYGRFFASVCMMVLGLDLICVSSTLDLLFAGWELLGLASFFLIGFYRNREQPLENSLAVFSAYRLGDLALLGSTMIGHLVFRAGDRLDMTMAALNAHEFKLAALFLVIAATCKSAQFPFLNILPRALEGPTPSSAIFYGSLSVHAGVLLLIRTYEFWQHYPGIRILIAIIGLLSALIAPALGRTMSNLKGQIAYATLAQVGLMFVEVAWGWNRLAMVHLILNAFLRIHQLLLSPSVVAHGLRVLADRDRETSNHLFDRLNLNWENSRIGKKIYRMTLFDFGLPFGVTQIFQMSSLLVSAQIAAGILMFAVAFATGYRWIECLLFAMATTLMFRATDASKPAIHSWLCIIGAFSAAVFALFVEIHDHHEMLTKIIVLYLAILFVGLLTLTRLPLVNSSEYHGLNERHPGAIRSLFFIFIIFIGSPISPLFFGEDLLLHAAVERGFLTGTVMAGVLFFGAITAARIWIRLGHGVKTARIDLPSAARLDELVNHRISAQ